MTITAAICGTPPQQNNVNINVEEREGAAENDIGNIGNIESIDEDPEN